MPNAARREERLPLKINMKNAHTQTREERNEQGECRKGERKGGEQSWMKRVARRRKRRAPRRQQ
jgi:hypothetical protein